MMELHDIYELLERFEGSSLEALHVKLKGDEFNAQRTRPEAEAKRETILPVKPAPRKAFAAEGATQSFEAAGEGDLKDEEDLGHHKVSSPIVGTFYARPAEDAPPYVSVGDTVKAGDVLCIIEAMKIMNEIKSPVGGIVKKVLAKEGDMLDFGRELFHIEEA